MAALGQAIGKRMVQAGWLVLLYGLFVIASAMYHQARETRATARVAVVETTCRISSARPDLYNPSTEMTCADAEQVRLASIASERVRIIRRVNATLEFVTKAGRKVSTRVPIDSLRYSSVSVGQRIPITYDATNPGVVHRATRRSGGGDGLGWIIAGVVLLVIGRQFQGNSRTAADAGTGHAAGGSGSGGGSEALASIVKTLQTMAKAAQQAPGAGSHGGRGGKPPIGRKSTASTMVRDRHRPGGPASAVAGKSGTKVLAKSRPRVVSPRRRGLFGLFR